MKKNYLQIGDQEFRVEVNWNAMMSFCEEKNIENLSELSNLGKIKPGDLLSIMYHSIKEGERMDGREMDITKGKLSEMVRTSNISDFLVIYKEQNGMDDGENNAGDSSKKKK